MKRSLPPQIRMGLCCGCKAFGDVPLYPVNRDRWRCAKCYCHEVGQFHWLTPAETIRAIVTKEVREAETFPPEGETNG